ncbi:MAG: O-methyltransferase [Pirellulales bacterium]
MNQDQWTAVEQFITGHLVQPDDTLDAALRESEVAGLPPINVPPNMGQLLHLLAKIGNAKNILEIGTLAGYSTIWLARALPPGGRLITLEADPKHAEIARTNIARAGLADVVELRLGRALDTLPQLAAENRGPFDLVFIDADKQNNADYFTWALRLARPGTLIIIDNVVRSGGVLDEQTTDKDAQGARRLYSVLAAEPRVTATAIQTVSSKGYDGFAIALVCN